MGSQIWSTILLRLQQLEVVSRFAMVWFVRWRWSAEDKGRIVAQSYAPGAVVSEVARRHEISPSISLLGARRRGTVLALPADLACEGTRMIISS
jgi:hypothetical protein